MLVLTCVLTFCRHNKIYSATTTKISRTEKGFRLPSKREDPQEAKDYLPYCLFSA